MISINFLNWFSFFNPQTKDFEIFLSLCHFSHSKSTLNTEQFVATRCFARLGKTVMSLENYFINLSSCNRFRLALASCYVLSIQDQHLPMHSCISLSFAVVDSCTSQSKKNDWTRNRRNWSLPIAVSVVIQDDWKWCDQEIHQNLWKSPQSLTLRKLTTLHAFILTTKFMKLACNLALLKHMKCWEIAKSSPKTANIIKANLTTMKSCCGFVCYQL